MILEASNISKSYKLNDKSIPILEHFDFQADAGEKIAVFICRDDLNFRRINALVFFPDLAFMFRISDFTF